MRNTLMVMLLLALLGAMYVAFTLGKDDTAKPAAVHTPPVSSAPPTQVVTGTPVAIVAAGDFDPEGDPPHENPEQVPHAIDGNDSTVWKTSIYRSDPRPRG